MYLNEYDSRSVSGNFLSLPIKYKNPKQNKRISKKPLKAPKTNPQILSKIKTPFASNFGDNQFEIILDKTKVPKNGKPKARKSTIISCDI